MFTNQPVKKQSQIELNALTEFLALYPGQFPSELQHSFQAFGIAGFGVDAQNGLGAGESDE